MRWRRRPDPCPQCGQEAQRGARWCGACGALLAPPVPTVEPDHDPGRPPAGGDPDDDSEEPVAAPTGRGMRASAVVLVLAMLVVAGVVTRPAPSGELLLGSLDSASGRTATVPPPIDLRTAWAHDIGAQVGEVSGGGPVGSPVVRGGRALAGGVVVELATGAVVADLREDPFWGAMITEDGVVSMLEGGRLAVVDALTGRLLRRAELDLDTDALRGREVDRIARVRGEQTSLVATWAPQGDDRWGYGGWVLLGDDGRVVATGDGFSDAWFITHGAPMSHASIIRPRAGEDPASPSYPGDERVVIDLATGDEVLVWDQPPDGSGMDLVGHHAFTAQPPGELEVTTDGFPWDVELLDLTSGRVVRNTQLVSVDRPVLLATTPSGDPVVALRRGSRVEVVVVEEAGPRSVLDVPVGLENGAWYSETFAQSVTASDGTVVVALDGNGTVTARDLDGTIRWRHETSEEHLTMGLGDGHVALASDGGHSQRLQLLSALDGAVVTTATIPPPAGFSHPSPQLTAVVDGLLAVAVRPDEGADGAGSLQAVDWFDLTDGRERALQDVAAGWSRRGLLGPDAWPSPGTPASDPPPVTDAIDSSDLLGQHLLGTVTGDDGRSRPVIGRFNGYDQLELLGSDGRLRTLDVPVAAGVGDRPDVYGWVVGGSRSWIVLARELPEVGPELVVVDLASGTGRIIPDMYGLQVLGDVVVGRSSQQEDQGLVAMDLRTGEERWHIDDQRWLWRVTGDERHVVTVDVGTVTLRDAESGEVLWRTDVERLLTGTALLTPTHVVVGTPHGEVVALDRDDGTVAWEVDVGAPVTTVSGAGEHVLLGTASGQVVHLDPDGRELERLTVGSSAVAAVAGLGETVVAVVGRRVIGLRVDGDGLTERDEVDLP